ncbi:hypothetical protein [Pseudomonas pergaminensis]|uniref:hypothetical protein n=1 Tax=Pseudomonas pergaminensis TaxID=2853159 RepID=UPI0034D6E083
MGDLAALAGRKAAQQQDRDKQLNDLKALLADGNADHSMRARILGPGATINQGERITSMTLAGNQIAIKWTTQSVAA